jgi:hypothetical protein
MRYGGFVLFALPIFIYTSKKIETYEVKKKKIYFSTIILILLTFTSYNVRNVLRLNKEVNKYSPSYNILKSPFFHVDDVKVNISYEKDGFKIYHPIDNMCWAAPTPCSYNSKINFKYWKGFKLIQRIKDN